MKKTLVKLTPDDKVEHQKGMDGKDCQFLVSEIAVQLVS
jgi:hypothetical protein